VGHRQVLQVVTAAALSLVLILGMAFDGGPASAHPYLIWRIYAGFAGAILTCAYVVHLRRRTAPFVLTPEKILWRDREVSRAYAAVRLLRWPHLIHDGTILEIGDPNAPLRVGVSHRLVPSSLLGPWHLHGQVDVILSPPDFSDVLDALGVAELGWRQIARRGPAATWLATVGVVTFFGLGVGFSGIGELMHHNAAVRVAVMAAMFFMIAVGGIMTFAHNARSAATRTPYDPAAVPPAADRKVPPTMFWRTVGRALSWQVMSAGIAFVLFVIPISLHGRAFAHWVDIPGCRADCSALHLPFRGWHEASKSTPGACVCGDRILRGGYTITGGTSVGAHIFDWFVRAASFIVMLLAWPFALAAPFVVWWKRRRRPADPIPRPAERGEG
jgi:hypothetical protein